MVPCQVHEYHAPLDHETQRHHVVPLSWEGPDVEANILMVCPGGHRNLHRLYNLWVYYRAEPSWEWSQHWGSDERAVARRAFADAARMGLTPKRT